MKLKDLVKIAAPIAIGSIAPGLMPGMNPVLARGLASGVGSLVMGGKPKDALLAGALGAGVGAMFPGQQAGAEQLSGSGTKLPIGSSGRVSFDQMAKKAVQDTVKGGAGTGAANTVAPVAADTMSAKLLESIGVGSDNLLFKALNTKLGEGVAAGLIAQLLAGDDDDEVVGEFERRPFGAGGPGGKIGGINYAQGGAVPSLMALSEASRQMADNVRQLTTGATGMAGPRSIMQNMQNSAMSNNRPSVGLGGGVGPLPVNPLTGQTDLAGGIAQGVSQQGIGNSVAEAGRIDFNIGKPIGFGPGQDPAVTPGLGFPSTMPVKTMFGAGDGRLRAQLVPNMAIPLPAFFKDGGSTYFPRRNGGIDPAEGSGKKDDVPAMLMAGEFVMTRDAVKGMGDGNLRKGINRMYGMMDNLERMA